MAKRSESGIVTPDKSINIPLADYELRYCAQWHHLDARRFPSPHCYLLAGGQRVFLGTAGDKSVDVIT